MTICDSPIGPDGTLPSAPIPPAAIVLGAHGRVGGAIVRRLRAAGRLVLEDPDDVVLADVLMGRPMLFDCAYRHGDPAGHVQRVAGHLARFRDYSAIFVPSSLWAGTDSDYGLAKRAVLALADFYRAIGAPVVTDPIGYFPGDDVSPDPAEPHFGQAIDGDALFARIMTAMDAAAQPGLAAASADAVGA